MAYIVITRGGTWDALSEDWTRRVYKTLQGAMRYFEHQKELSMRMYKKSGVTLSVALFEEVYGKESVLVKSTIPALEDSHAH